MIKQILVPLDGSELAEQALYQARMLATKSGANIHVLRVVTHEPSIDELPMGQSSTAFQIGDAEWTPEDVSAYLHGMTLAYARAGALAVPHLRHGVPSDEIVAVAREIGADLIVMTTHGRSGFSRWAV